MVFSWIQKFVESRNITFSNWFINIKFMSCSGFVVQFDLILIMYELLLLGKFMICRYRDINAWRIIDNNNINNCQLPDTFPSSSASSVCNQDNAQS